VVGDGEVVGVKRGRGKRIFCGGGGGEGTNGETGMGF